MATVDQRSINSCGTPESDWQGWLHSGSIKTCALPDLITCNQRLIVVAPHPDDEVLACGGLLAMHQLQGGKIVVVSVTDGEASHADSPHWQAAELATVRHQELLDGLEQLGLKNIAVKRLALPDGAIFKHAVFLERALIDLLEPADVVVTTWRLDGHPDHEATARVVTDACSRLGCRLIEAPVWMWHWATLNDLAVPWHRLHQLPLTPRLIEQKQAALAAHTSQLDPFTRAVGAVLDDAIVARIRRDKEYFFIE